MALFREIAQKDIDKMSPIVKELFYAMKPILEEINPETLDLNKSYLEVEWGTFDLIMTIQAKEKLIPPLNLIASEENFSCWILNPLESDYEDKPEPDSASIAYTVNKIQRYLQGITIVLHYDSKDKLIKQVYYYGLANDESDEQIIGSHQYFSFKPFFLKKKTVRTQKITYSFLIDRKL